MAKADASEKGYAVLRAFEGRALRAYLCPANVWTIGYGATNADKDAVAYLGRKIGPGLRITEAQAEHLLRQSIRKSYAPEVAAAMPGAKQHELDAGISFHFNTGAIKRASWVRAWKAGDRKGADANIRLWNKGGGRVLAGLVRRRAREAAILLHADYGPEGDTAAPVHAVDASPLGGTSGMLRLGDQGPEVEALNDLLRAFGFDVPAGDKFTDATDRAVRAYQKAHPQLDVDGIVGPATRAAMEREAYAKGVVKKGTAATAPGAASAAAADYVTGGGVPLTVWIVAGIVVFGALAFYAWRYRDEIAAWMDRSRKDV